VSKKKVGARKAAKAKKDADPSPEEGEEDKAFNALMTEIESDLRDEQLQQLWDRYSNWIYAGLASLVLGVAAYQYWDGVQADQLSAQANTFTRALEGLEAGNTETALTDLATVAEQGGNYGALAKLRRASILLQRDDTQGAIAIFRGLSEDVTLDLSFTDLATLLWALHGLDTEDPATLKDALSPLTSANNAYNYSALELMALLAVRRGDIDEAIDIFDNLLADTNTPSAIRARAEELSAVYKSPGSTTSPMLEPISEPMSAPESKEVLVETP
jgi:hypothetical protein